MGCFVYAADGGGGGGGGGGGIVTVGAVTAGAVTVGAVTAGDGASLGITPPAERPKRSHPTTKRITRTTPPISIIFGLDLAGGIICYILRLKLVL